MTTPVHRSLSSIDNDQARALDLIATLGISFAGLTTRLEPTTTNRSQRLECRKESSRSFWGRGSPKFTTLETNLPPHLQVSKPRDLSTWFWHCRHLSFVTFPCNSASNSGRIPDRKWRLSTFWEMRNYNLPKFCNSTIARWAALGSTEAKGRVFVGSPLACLVQMPFGPRKSGSPDSVLMPAPVKTTRYFAPNIHWANLLIRSSKSFIRSQCFRLTLNSSQIM